MPNPAIPSPPPSLPASLVASPLSLIITVPSHYFFSPNQNPLNISHQEGVFFLLPYSSKEANFAKLHFKTFFFFFRIQKYCFIQKALGKFFASAAFFNVSLQLKKILNHLSEYTGPLAVTSHSQLSVLQASILALYCRIEWRDFLKTKI